MKNLNFDFLLDIWADLKAKNLAPVAIGLVVAAVAIPALLMKGEESASDGPLPILASNPTGGPEVEVAQELADRGSKLDSYKARDPFKGRVKPEDGELPGGGMASVPGAGGGSAPGKGSSSGSSGSTLPGLGSGGGGSTGSTPPAGGGDLGGPTTPPSVPKLDTVTPKRRLYTYQLSVKFGRPGREQRYPELGRMSFLPRPNLPVLLFLGVPEGARSAIFLVHPGMTHQGEGSCVPSPRQCNFLELEIGEQHYVAANDLEFRVELLKIKRVPLSQEKKQRAAARKASQRRLSRGGTDGAPGGATGDASAEPEFPWLVDGIG